MLYANRFAAPAQRVSTLGPGYRAAEPGEGLAELRIRDSGKPAADEFGPVRGGRAQTCPARRRIEGQRPLH